MFVWLLEIADEFPGNFKREKIHYFPVPHMVVQILWAAFYSFIYTLHSYTIVLRQETEKGRLTKKIYVQLYAVPKDYSIKLAYSEPSKVVPLPSFWYVKGK